MTKNPKQVFVEDSFPLLDSVQKVASLADLPKGINFKYGKVFRKQMGLGNSSKVVDFFNGMCSEHGLNYRGQQIRDVDSSDIAVQLADFPATVKARGLFLLANSVPKSAVKPEGCAFRAELRKGHLGYIAIGWESIGNCRRKYQVMYAVKDKQSVRDPDIQWYDSSNDY